MRAGRRLGRGLTVRQTFVEVASKDVLPEDRACPVCGVEHKGRVLKEPKSLAGERWVPLVSPARAALVAHRETQLAERAQFDADYADHDLVFCAPDGTPLRPGTVTSQFKAHARTCDLPAIALHDTRHGACSLLLSGGVPIEVVQMILGHSTPAITRAVYAHVMKKATAQQVEDATRELTRHRRSRPGGVQAT